MPQIAIPGPWRRVIGAGVSLLPMAREANAERRASAPETHDPMSLSYTTDLAAVRAVVQRYAALAGLPEARVIDLVLAVSEVAANTVRHARSPGCLKIWYDATEIICQIEDEGTINDPLAGQRRPSLGAQGGHGLWIVYQVCDRVEIESGETGTRVRLYMAIPGG
jgi:anti-sigma regulatory factor (Ser/Thr protein kinase)